MGRFAGLAGVQVNKGGIFFEPGNYLVRLGKIEFKMTGQGRNIPTFIVNTEIIESDCPARGAGSRPSWVVKQHQEYPHYIWSDMKAFAGALLSIGDPDAYHEPVTAADMAAAQPGENPQDVADKRFWDDNLEMIVGPTQPMNGVLIRLNCTHIPPGPRSKPGSTGHTRHTWGPVVDENTVGAAVPAPDDNIPF